jgi:hypothetical protein
MKRAALMVAVAALWVAGVAEAQDRSGGLIGSGTRTDDSGQTMGSGGFTTSTQSSQILGSGARSADSGQMVGSGGFTASPQDQWLGNGDRSEDTSPILGSGGRAENGGYLGSGLSIRQVRLSDDSSLLVVSSDKGTFLIPIQE